MVAGHTNPRPDVPLSRCGLEELPIPQGAFAPLRGLCAPLFDERRPTVIASAREKEAIVQFLEYLRDGRQARRRLFQRASEEPQKVVVYLDTLPRGVEREDELKRRLRTIANAALQGRMHRLREM